MLIALLFSSSILFVLEQDVQHDKFASIPDAMWWALATLTTVGYGDVAPITPLGRFFGGITMIIGMFAQPTGVIATGFADEIKKGISLSIGSWSRTCLCFKAWTPPRLPRLYPC